MNFEGPSTCLVMTVEIALLNDLSEELQDAIVDDLTYEGHLDRLTLLIKKWARAISGENCHVAIDVE